MNPTKITGATHEFQPPEQFDEAVYKAPCTSLSVRMEGGPASGRGTCESAWKPDAQELADLVVGGSVILSIAGHQPPVRLSVDPPLYLTPEQRAADRDILHRHALSAMFRVFEKAGITQVEGTILAARLVGLIIAQAPEITREPQALVAMKCLRDTIATVTQDSPK
jgi:hypothetical protein